MLVSAAVAWSLPVRVRLRKMASITALKPVLMAIRMDGAVATLVVSVDEVLRKVGMVQYHPVIPTFLATDLTERYGRLPKCDRCLHRYEPGR